jgi:Stage II sporulation protein E (SpoIIE)
MGWIRKHFSGHKTISLSHLSSYAMLIAISIGVAAGTTVRAQVAAPTLSIEQLGKGIATIDGQWQFHLGDDPVWSTADVDDRTGHAGWEQLTADSPWGAQGHPSYAGYAWYRKRLHVSAAPGTPQDFAVLIGRIEDAYEIYWNGKLIARNGEMPPDPMFYYVQAPQTFGLGSLGDGVLAIRVWKAPLTSFDNGVQGGFYAPPLIGSHSAIADRKAHMDYTWLHSRQYDFALHSFYGLMMLLSLLMWIRDRSQRVLLWMAAFTGAPLAAFFLTGMRLPWPYKVAIGVLQPVLSISDISLWFLLLYLLKLNENTRLARFTRFLAIVSLVSTTLDGLLTLVDWSNPKFTAPAQIADGALTLIFTVAEIYPVVLVAFALRKHLDAARWMMATCAFFFGMLTVVRVALQQGSRYTHWTFGEKIAVPLFTINGNPFALQTLAATGLLISVVYAVYRYSREEAQRQQAVEQELRSAQELQQVLIPEELPELQGFALTSSYRPAQEVGGDFFQIIPLEDAQDGSSGSTLIVIGDVSGKGLRAAMAVSLIVGAVRTLAESVNDPAVVLGRLNTRMHGRLQHGFVTCMVLLVRADGYCSIASAGHPFPYLNSREIVLPDALPLGLVTTTSYEKVAFELGVGDRLTLYTDGLLEARSKSGDIFGFDRLRELMATKPDARGAIDAAIAFGQEDDITVLTLTRLGAGEESSTRLIAPVLAPA